MLKYPGRFGRSAATPGVNQRWQYHDDLMKGYRTGSATCPPTWPAGIAWENGATLFGVKTP